MSPTEVATVLVLIVVFLVFCRTIHSMAQHRRHNPPPGPIGLPVIGHLHMLGKLPHRTLHKLSQKYGPIMSLRLGSVPTIIVSSPAAAELFLKTHDIVFASRPKTQAAQYLMYGTKGMGYTEYGVYWRMVRKFCTMELLSATKINSMVGMRREELGLLVESLKEAARTREVVDVTNKVAGFIEATTFRMLFGKSRDDRFHLSGILHEMAEILGAFNIVDYIPFMKALDLQGLTRRMKTASNTMDKILETIIDDHERDATNGHKDFDGDFLDVILSLKNNPTSTHEQLAHSIDQSNIKAIIVDLIFATIDTSQTAIEWTMTELIRQPRVMTILQQEIKNVIGNDEVVEESHLSKLDYLDMVVKESMRLHPVAPLFAPHESMEDIVINGYYIKKKSRIMINYWSIAQDPKIWSENVEEFLPERFEGSNIDLRGKCFELIPFSSGRRGCPGMNLGLITVKLVVAQLVHSFNWELPLGMSPNELDMDETFGLMVPRANHLLAIPGRRL